MGRMACHNNSLRVSCTEDCTTTTSSITDAFCTTSDILGRLVSQG